MNRHCLVVTTMMALLVFGEVSRVSAGIIQELAAAKILEDFKFDDASGTAWSAAANSANPGNLLVASASGDTTALTGVTTNGAGALNASLKANDDNGRMLVDTPNNLVNGRVLGVMEVTWDFDPAGPNAGQGEELRITLINSGTTSVTAEAEILRGDDDKVTMFGSAIGTGSSNIAAEELNGGSLTQSQTFIAVVEADLGHDTYRVFYSNDGGSSFSQIGSGGTIDPARIVDKMRIYLNNDMSNDHVLVSRSYLAYVPEPASGMLLLLGSSLLVACRRRK
jgi:PEP-CTERM motif